METIKPKYIAAVVIENQSPENMNISLGFENNGTMGVYLQDTTELGQDSQYINNKSFPNSGLITQGKYSLWLSMFARHAQAALDDLN